MVIAIGEVVVHWVVVSIVLVTVVSVVCIIIVVVDVIVARWYCGRSGGSSSKGVGSVRVVCSSSSISSSTTSG